MSSVYITGLGAVSPAGWSIAALRDAITKNRLLASQELVRPGRQKPLRIMRVPPPEPRPTFLGHARLRRTSPITQFAVAAAVEALGQTVPKSEEIGVIVCVFSGCVNYSRRFYDEALKNPATASPLVFPETVFNAPASHIAAYIGSTAINYTLVGDAGTFLVAMAVAAQWLLEHKVQKCLVVGTEEIDWLTSDALRLFDRSKFLSEGAGAVLLSLDPLGALAQLTSITDEFLYARAGGKQAALRAVREQLNAAPVSLLCDSSSSEGGISRDETEVWRDWRGPRLSPKRALGDGLMASAGWQFVAAADALSQGRTQKAIISMAGFHQHAIGCELSSPA